MFSPSTRLALLSHSLMDDKSRHSSNVHRSARHDLQQAIRMRDSSAINRLVLESKVSVNYAVRGTTPLSLAVYLGQSDTVQQLIDLGANVNQMSRDHNDRLEPPLFTACRLGMETVVKSLLDASADVNKTDFYNQSPLWISTRERRLDLVKLLLKFGASVNMAQKGSECPLYLATKYLGYTGRREIAKLLISSGINLNVSDAEGRTPLYWAFKNCDKTMSKILVLCGGEIKPPLTWTNVDKELGRDLKGDDKFYEWLKMELNTPYPLQRQCLRFLRQHLSSVNVQVDMQCKIRLLPLPKTLIRYLSLEFLVTNQLM